MDIGNVQLMQECFAKHTLMGTGVRTARMNDNNNFNSPFHSKNEISRRLHTVGKKIGVSMAISKAARKKKSRRPVTKQNSIIIV